MKKEIRAIQHGQLRQLSDETIAQKKEARRQFMRNKALIQQKIKQLKDQNRSIEEIYKYTNNIIFEDDDEQIETHR